MDVLVALAPVAAFVAGAGVTLLAERFRKRLPPVDRVLNDAGIPGPCRVHGDGQHIIDTVINDGRGWKCKCGARAGKG